MKTVLLFIAALTVTGAMARSPKPIIGCTSQKMETGWNGVETNDYVYFSAFPASSERIEDAVIKGAFESDRRDLVPVRNYRPANPKYANYNKFEPLEDAWRWFNILLPKDYARINGGFLAYIQIYREETGYERTITLDCYLQ